MANIATANPIYISEAGVISIKPMRITKIRLHPSASGDAATFVYWQESDDPVTTYGTRDSKTVTVTASTRTLASVGNFENDSINPLQIIKIHATSSGDNIGTYMITDNADDNTITVYNPASIFGQSVTMANDTSETYSWKVWDTRTLCVAKGSGVTNDVQPVDIDFPIPFTVPNLAVHTISTNAVLYIYLR